MNVNWRKKVGPETEACGLSDAPLPDGEYDLKIKAGLFIAAPASA